MQVSVKILTSLIIVGLVSSGAILLSNAFFSDTETSAGNLLQAGELDLQIDNTSYYNQVLSTATTWTPDNLPGHLFFNFTDLKPGDIGEDTISLLVQNPAWACMRVALTQNSDQTCTEPELVDDPGCPDTGDLADQIHFAFWNDDGDNVYENTETVFKTGTASALLNGTTWTLTDSASSIWGPAPSPLPANQTQYVGKFWCFGTLTPAPAAPADNDPTIVTGFICDGTALNNASQTDKVLADVQFTAIQARHNPNFLCLAPPAVTPTPTPLACIEDWADTVESSSQGTRKNGSAVLATRTTPATALVAQTTGAAFDPAPVEGTFFSLGFKNAGTTPGGEIVVGFAAPFFNGPGPDLRIYEVTGGPPYPDEHVRVEVSSSAAGPWTPLSASLLKDGTVDLGILPSAQFVRLTDISNFALFEPTADAYDVDGVQALCATN